ncbi:MAG TPA: hypothetical protein VM240_14865 [Verrucomicrobiae bacterium]|nr:hypothetical protein [Verrucomicrobiae bacterium]
MQPVLSNLPLFDDRKINIKIWSRRLIEALHEVGFELRIGGVSWPATSEYDGGQE